MSGRFLRGNPGGPGNPHAAAMSRFRSLLLDAVTPADLKAIVKAQVSKARKGDPAAARLILSYVAGAPMTAALAVSVGQERDPDEGVKYITIFSNIPDEDTDPPAPSPNGPARLESTR